MQIQSPTLVIPISVSVKVAAPISAWLTWKLPTRPRTQMFARCWWCKQPDVRWCLSVPGEVESWGAEGDHDDCFWFTADLPLETARTPANRLFTPITIKFRRVAGSTSAALQETPTTQHTASTPQHFPHRRKLQLLSNSGCTIFLDLGNRLGGTWSSQLSYFDGSFPVGLIINISSLHPVRWAVFILIFIHVTFGVINSSWDFYFWLWCLMKASSLSTSSERLVVSKTDEHDGGQQHLDKVIPAKSTRLVKTSFVLMLEDQINVETQSFKRIIPFQSFFT